MKRVYYILLAFIIATPIGLYLTDAPAWGEWDSEYYKEVLGFIPKSIKETTQVAPIPDYSLHSLGDVGSYYLSAIVGVCLIFGFFYILKKAVRHA